MTQAGQQHIRFSDSFVNKGEWVPSDSFDGDNVVAGIENVFVSCASLFNVYRLGALAQVFFPPITHSSKSNKQKVQ